MQDKLSEVASEEEVMSFDGVYLREAPKGLIDAVEIEPSEVRPFTAPNFIFDASGLGRSVRVPEIQRIHGSRIAKRNDVLLFGSSNLVSRDGVWTTDNAENRGVSLAYMQMPFFSKLFPGDLPEIFDIHTTPKLKTETLSRKKSVIKIDEGVFVGTALEPPTWGRWVAGVIPRAQRYMSVGSGRKFLCHVEYPWERRILNEIGIADDDIIAHQPGHTYLCRDIMYMEEFASDGPTISSQERLLLSELKGVGVLRRPATENLFVSRRTATSKNPRYRPLMNEEELAEKLTRHGFRVIEPELMSLRDQAEAFYGARSIVFVGGSAIYNSAFCQSDVRVVTIEASTTFLPTHLGYLSSLDIECAVVLGTEDPDDERPNHTRWTIDVEAAWRAIADFVN